MPTKEILISFFFICFHLTVNAQNCNDAIHTGEGTFYGGVAGVLSVPKEMWI